MAKITILDIVVPATPSDKWEIGKVIGMSRFDLSIGPLLKIRDIISGNEIELFPMHVRKLIVAP